MDDMGDMDDMGIMGVCEKFPEKRFSPIEFMGDMAVDMEDMPVGIGDMPFIDMLSRTSS